MLNKSEFDFLWKIIHPGWEQFFRVIFEKQSYFQKLLKKIQQEYHSRVCFPEMKNIFRCFALFSPQKTKVVILGQDPYHNYNQADGLAFSVQAASIPPSLQNIFKEIRSETGIKNKSGNLLNWANQGVLLLNSALSVVAHKPGSHSKIGWHLFVRDVLRYLNKITSKRVYLFWGRAAQQLGAVVGEANNLILRSAHPSPLSAHCGFIGNKHFVKTNDFLTLHQQLPINWNTVENNI